MLTFDPEAHVYRVDGIVYPSVTQIVSRVIPRAHYANEWHLHKGEMVHKSAALLLRGRLDWESVDARIMGRVKAVEKCASENGFAASLIEERFFHPTLKYAGTIDALTYRTELIDWKCSDSFHSIPQLGGYCILLEAAGYNVKRCFSVELNDDETYRISEHKPNRCRALFTACYSLYGFLVENKVAIRSD